eukprot:CAMPEP_0172893268 /NCGR_PEP_ID=MMETSP1075-20121228/148091_1 /TAXON_ID=2916 /ORGANISM="Ceratium fusus, Strain PA161109" /LENGTH=76 /DNA_ID=CAMNT_0013748103 /DNA_START=1396 /DNA_END=1623 /DNA_ORIENTATION=+
MSPSFRSAWMSASLPTWHSSSMGGRTRLAWGDLTGELTGELARFARQLAPQQLFELEVLSETALNRSAMSAATLHK